MLLISLSSSSRTQSPTVSEIVHYLVEVGVLNAFIEALQLASCKTRHGAMSLIMNS
jgi:hypothetical protein